jgi:iron complex outermembrane recepter protein
VDQDLVNRCYLGDTALCALIQRDAAGNPKTLTLAYVNADETKTSGADFELAYATPMSRFSPSLSGNLSLRVLATYVRELTTNDGVSSDDVAGIVGTGYGGVPHWRANTSATYSTGPWSSYLEARYIGGGQYTNSYTVNDNSITGQLLFNGSLRYSFDAKGTKLQVFAGVNNIFNKAPPFDPQNFTEPVQTNAVLYDVIGRNFTVGLRGYIP